jgi:hypothetical protein
LRSEEGGKVQEECQNAGAAFSILTFLFPRSSFLFPLDRRSIFPPDSDERIAALGGKRKGTGGMTER